jgi:hypothetical protein
MKANMTPALDRLETARWFLGEMRIQRKPTPKLDPSPFRHYLSAFLMASRSVTNLFEKRERTWYREWRLRQPEADIAVIDYMIEERNLEAHDNGADVAMTRHSVPAHEVPGLTTSQPPMAAVIAEAQRTGQSVNPDDYVSKAVITEFAFAGISGSAEEALSLCTRYLQILNRLASDYARGEGREPR